MGDAKPADIDWANPGPVRPGMGLYGRQQQRAKSSILGMLKGSLLSERQQQIYYYVLFVVTFSVSWFIDRPGQQSYLLADRVRRRFLETTFRPDLASVSPRACLRARGPLAGIETREARPHLRRLSCCPCAPRPPVWAGRPRFRAPGGVGRCPLDRGALGLDGGPAARSGV